MNTLKACTLTVLLSTLTFARESRAVTIAPPLESQVEQVADWFSGSFNNSQQVASNPSVPLITMNSCEVQLAGANPIDEMQNVYLEQSSGKVVSNVEVFGDRINSLDQIFAPNGTLIAATPIEFERIASVPEASSILGLVAFGLWSMGKARSRKQKKTSTQNENIPLYILSERNS